MDYIQQLIDLVKRWSSYLGFTTLQNFEDQFYQLLHDKHYDDALKLAKQHKYLDVDLVYKCRWRNSGITVKSINFVLANIQDKLWTINECVQTVPISYEACRTLIEFGLKEASLRLLYELGNEPPEGQEDVSKDRGISRLIGRHNTAGNKQTSLDDNLNDAEFEGLIDFENLNDRQKELCRCRQNLIRYEHSLSAYESILGDYRTIQQHFDHVFYDEFRQKCPLENCIHYANDADVHAVEVCLNFYTDYLAQHLLSILSNFPETLSPYQYRNLLPCLRQGETIYEWQPRADQVRREDFDWSQRDPSISIASALKENNETYEKEFYNANSDLKKYLKVFDSELLTEWFIARALEMESRTLLLSNAIQLLLLGLELNIKNLKDTHDDLMEFNRIVYDCCSEKNIYLSYKEFCQMPLIERLLLITGDSVKNCKDKFRFYVITYLHRLETTNKLTASAKDKLIRDYFIRLAHSNEKICKQLYNDLLDRIESDEFVYEWTKDLDDTIDEIGAEIKTIERKRQAEQLVAMANQTMALGDYNECYEACQLIMKKEFKECWPSCCQLGMQKQFINFSAKYKLLAFALVHCDDPDGKMSVKILDHIIELRKRDEKIQAAYLQLNM